MNDLVLKQFERPDETRTFEKGKFEVIRLGQMTIGRAAYEPGWKWSEHVGRGLGEALCRVEHVGLVVSGRVAVAMENGEVLEIKPGDAFHIRGGHDSWVIGDQPYVSLHFSGADEYTTR